MKRVCVFCGSNPGLNPAYAAAARALGGAIAARGLGLIYGGGHVGLMGIVADAAMRAGAEVIGIIPETLMQRELGHGAITELRVVATMHERKAMMADLADGFVVLPGGIGTLEEAVEAFTWTQLGIHDKGLVFLNTARYWERLGAVLDHMVSEGFLHAKHRAMVTLAAAPEEALDALESFAPVAVEKWAERSER
ncbi:TIGR00730 family Rossman fold protein [Roseomonas sp. M0104]|uniref:Cytokinin riboside 5'-monophosphate phosphoribohydrolase n=1 Tax=Teichococcus coralli TaxID=2545983 RepID=A0A845BAJ7_9PROT|nr:TIGR00730 family Rossman fold protein [Pseudoroseomonas coralli]MXP63805.1 TIGR00730 family Rossman fold protein [Pseudoroseomonas coralli]